MNRAVFLDRDGTVTRNTFLVVDPKDAVLEERATDGVKLLNTLGFKVIIVTNQPQVARGLVTEEDVGRINNKIVADLKEKGAHIDAVYFCPHHPETHHIDVPEHAKKYRIACECRKPRTGMLDKAAKDFNIDLSKSFVVGDQTMDILAGKNAGCKTLLVRTGEAGMDGKHDAKPDFVCDNLYRAAVLIKRNLTVKAVILAGGRGERLRPLTDKLPKPMIQVGGKPVLQHQIEALKKSGITEIILCGSYLVDEIKKYFGSGEEFGVNMQYPHEPEHLGSGGAVKNASAYLKDAGRFIVMNGDKMVGSEFDFEQMLDYDDGKDGFMTVLVRETDHPLDSDILKLDEHNKVVGFIGRGQNTYRTSNSGIIIAKPSLLDLIPDGRSNIEKDVTFRLIKDKDVYAFLLPKNWFVKDMGTPERLEAVRKHFESQI